MRVFESDLSKEVSKEAWPIKKHNHLKILTAGKLTEQRPTG